LKKKLLLVCALALIAVALTVLQPAQPPEANEAPRSGFIPSLNVEVVDCSPEFYVVGRTTYLEGLAMTINNLNDDAITLTEGKAELRDENNNPVRIGSVYPPEYIAKVVLPGIIPSGTTTFTARVISSVLEVSNGQTYTLKLTMSELTATTSGLRTTEGEYVSEIRTPERPD